MQEIFKNIKEIELENALYVISTPIGNMYDITIRGLQIIEKLDTILCEDTRVTNKLLDFYGFKNKSLLVYNDFSEDSDRRKIVNMLKSGRSIGIVSDAGTPVVSDPGFKLVRECKSSKIKVIPICGASASLSALAASGLASDKFLFYGFLSEKDIKRRKEIVEFKNRTESIIIYESPKRILFTLDEIKEILGDVDICIAREITKMYEEIKTDKISELIKYYNLNQDKVRGEFVLIIKNEAKKINKNFDVEKVKIIYGLTKDKMKLKEIADFIIKIGYNYNKKELYEFLLELNEE